MEDQQQQTQNTTLCNAGCGFYGSAATEGLCSKCFKDSIKRTQDTTARLSPGPNPASSTSSMPSTPIASPPTSSGEIVSTSPQQPINSAVLAAAINTSGDGNPNATQFLTPESSALVIEDVVTNLSTSSSAASLGLNGGADDPSATPPLKKPNRCHECKKRVGLTGFTCRCGGLYCGEHRYDTAHNCKFDYKTMEREEIRKNNPVVVSEKIKRL